MTRALNIKFSNTIEAFNSQIKVLKKMVELFDLCYTGMKCEAGQMDSKMLPTGRFVHLCAHIRMRIFSVTGFVTATGSTCF